MPVTKLVTVLIFAIFWPRHPKKGVPELTVGGAPGFTGARIAHSDLRNLYSRCE